MLTRLGLGLLILWTPSQQAMSEAECLLGRTANVRKIYSLFQIDAYLASTSGRHPQTSAPLAIACRQASIHAGHLVLKPLRVWSRSVSFMIVLNF